MEFNRCAAIDFILCQYDEDMVAEREKKKDYLNSLTDEELYYEAESLNQKYIEDARSDVLDAALDDLLGGKV